MNFIYIMAGVIAAFLAFLLILHKKWLALVICTALMIAGSILNGCTTGKVMHRPAKRVVDKSDSHHMCSSVAVINAVNCFGGAQYGNEMAEHLNALSLRLGDGPICGHKTLKAGVILGLYSDFAPVTKEEHVKVSLNYNGPVVIDYSYNDDFSFDMFGSIVVPKSYTGTNGHSMTINGHDGWLYYVLDSGGCGVRSITADNLQRLFDNGASAWAIFE